MSSRSFSKLSVQPSLCSSSRACGVGQRSEGEWRRAVEVAIRPWLFGREVNRKQAEQAEKATEEAAQAKKKGEGLKQAILTHPSVAGNGQESPSSDVAALYLAARST